MATNLGIDFGSTYTTLSYYDDITRTVQAIPSPDGSYYIPSVACLNEFDELLLGREALGEMRSDHALKPFRAFKMMLHEQNQETLRLHGYGEQTPETVAAQFLKKYISFAAEGPGVEQFDNAVICVPEHWSRSCSSMSGRAVLMDICKKELLWEPQKAGEKGLPMLKNVKVITEPVAASAYYAHSYCQKYRSPFEGIIIVIDYGGGTLDITVTEVTAKNSGSATNVMEIDACWRTGSGENHPDRIGDAGLAYMENVTLLALKRAGFRDIEIDGAFLRAEEKLEKELMEKTKNLRRRVNQNGMGGLEDMAEDHETFVRLPYRHKQVPVTYAMLYEVFERYIQPVLEENLRELAAYLQKKNIDLRKDMDRIKIAVVGGFGQFPLVQKAVWDFCGYVGSEQDITAVTRPNNPDQGGMDDKRTAISYGAALIAANAVSVKVTSKYAIGLRVTRNGQETYDYAIRCGQPVIPNHIYPLGGKWEPIGYGESSKHDDPEAMPWVFAINNIEDADFAYRMVPRPEVSRKLQEDIHESGAYFFAFSMDESEIYTVYIYPQDRKTAKRIESQVYVQSLGNFNDIFGANVVFSTEEKNILRPYR